MPDTEKARSVLEQQALDYRARAEQLRTVGETLGSQNARRILLDLASEADRMATKIEAQITALRPAS